MALIGVNLFGIIRLYLMSDVQIVLTAVTLLRRPIEAASFDRLSMARSGEDVDVAYYS